MTYTRYKNYFVTVILSLSWFIVLVTYSSISLDLTDWAVELIVAKISKRMRLTIMRSEKLRTWKKNVINATKMITNDCA